MRASISANVEPPIPAGPEKVNTTAPVLPESMSVPEGLVFPVENPSKLSFMESTELGGLTRGDCRVETRGLTMCDQSLTIESLDIPYICCSSPVSYSNGGIVKCNLQVVKTVLK